MADKRVNMDIKEWLWKEVGITAIKEGITKKDLVEGALIEYIYTTRTTDNVNKEDK